MKQATLALIFAILLGGTATAQNVFIQIEAHSDIATAQERVGVFAENLPDIRGLEIGSRWYGIALGPYDRETAKLRLEALKELGMIPADSYLADRESYTRQYYPVDTDAPSPPQITSDDRDPATEPVTEPQPPDIPAETRRQALQSESRLSAERKLALQRALRDLGFYQSSLDAVFGRGTRRAMAEWQVSKGYEPTEVLTTRQRKEITVEHGALLVPLGLRTHIDEIAGIELRLPGAMVAFDRYEPPFAHYSAIDGSGASVTLVSQTGDAVTLRALYDVMENLAIVTQDARHQRTSSRFTISSVVENKAIFVHARLVEGAVKGFILTWPNQDDTLFAVLVYNMLESFTPISGSVMPDVLAGGALGSPIDLFSDLDLREPHASHSGFYIDGEATVLTAFEAVNGCQRITLDGIHDAATIASDRALGLALLKPDQSLVPPGYAKIRLGIPQLRSRIAVSGYSYGGRLNAPTLTFGLLADHKGLDDEETLMRLALIAKPGDAGGPIIDDSGSVVGLLLPTETESPQRLPPDVSFAVNTGAIAGFFERTGFALETTNRSTGVTPVAMARLANDMTVLVDCWAK